MAEFPLADKMRGYEKFPLHEAVRKGEHNVVDALLKAGALPNLENDSGERPLDLARENNDAVMEKILTDKGAHNSRQWVFDELKHEAQLNKSPVLWMENLSVTYSTKRGEKDKKWVTVPAKDIHRELRATENLFRRKLENIRASNPSKAKKTPEEIIHNRPQGEVILLDEVPNFVVAALTFVVSDSKKTKEKNYGRTYTDAIHIKVERDPQKNIYHVKDFMPEGTFNEEFIERRKKYAGAAKQVYEKRLESPIVLDSSGEVDFSNSLKSGHGEQALYEHLEQVIVTIIKDRLFNLKLKSGGFIHPKHKVYAIIIDMYSTREMCGNCVDRTIGMQNLQESGTFKWKIAKALQELQLSFPKGGIRIITRLSSDPSTPLDSDWHVPSPDDVNSQVGVFISEKKSAEAKYPAGQCRLFRRPIDLKQTRNCFMLASAKRYTIANLSGAHIEPKPTHTIFTSKKTPEQEEVYRSLFNVSKKK
jgi:hypothetical protein